ncbi:alanine/glycine:cation symporter family protein [Permianibacter aggregans]|uniref:AGCS family alanine or glycine:cation symporter n=1 Tax=Permianibacter aggregans TaxID=1510150 RepID=A0A4R6UTH9_9GAMM|nr:sodium:alanine symporter family protein [Permianibacter aggregans]QGX38316.1 sodium:alanine symporter family protein [Permianibacter aggregans]TDQ48635.1 AGCS family alanine or glycine:cation symporter [Permianibacter aggregans]
MDAINNFLLLLDSYLGSAVFFPYVLLGTGVFFTIYLGFPQIRYFGQALRIVTGKYSKKDAPGDTSHFQALTTALSGTVGTGNIGGVALALFIGGPAALFWMWMTAFFGMTTKFVEVTLSHKYRVKTEEGTMAGGPMYFMERKLGMKWLAVTFAIATVVCSFGSGNMPQSNNIAAGIHDTFHIPHWVTGAVLSALLFLVIVGGIKRIAQVAEKIVPTMAFLYVGGALYVIVMNAENIIPSFVAIFSDLFNGSAAVGGFLGASVALAWQKGVARGLFSNEAGQGSAAIAHSSARGNEPASEGMVSLLEPFIDTIIICTLTGLVILSTGVWNQKHENTFTRTDMTFINGEYSDTNPAHVAILGQYLGANPASSGITVFNGELQVDNGKIVGGDYTLLNSRSVAEDYQVLITNQAGERTPYSGPLKISNGNIDNTGAGHEMLLIHGKSLVHSVPLTIKAFSAELGIYGEYIVAIGLMLFAFTTAIAWSYYGDRAIIYLVGQKGVLPYRILYVLGFMSASMIDTTVVWNLAYVTVAFMTLPNLFGILMLHKDMKQTVKDYWTHFKATGAD